MNLFQVLIDPESEERENGDRLAVVEAANLLQTGEFQLLQLAYRDWFGKDLEEERLNGLFSDYMLKEETPSWARHYARRIIQLSKEGRLDYNDPVYHRFDPHYQKEDSVNVRKFFHALFAVVFVLSGSIYLAAQVASQQKYASIVPPFFKERTLHTHLVRPDGHGP